MNEKLIRKNRRLSNLYIAMWIVPIILVWMVILLNYLTKGSREIVKDYLFAMLFVLLVFLPGIVFNVILKKKVALYPQRKRFIFFFTQLAFMGCAFIGLVEGGLDANKTTEQVKQVIEMIKNSKRTVYLESIDVELQLKNEYEIGDVIDFDIQYSPSKATEKDIIVEIDNKIVNVDLNKNKITCLSNGKCQIKFYDSHNPEVTDTITIVINSLVLERIDVPTNQVGTKDLFLSLNEEYQLTPSIYPLDAINVNLQYQSNNPEIAVVDSFGKVKGLKAGTTKITCFDGDIKDEIYVTVDPITEFRIAKKEYDLKPGRNNAKEVQILPNTVDSYNKKYLSVVYSSDLNFKISEPSLRPIDKKVVFTATNYEEDLIGTHVIDIKVVYQYPGGTKITASFKTNLIGYQVFDIQNVDLNKTKLEITEDIYYDSNHNLVTRLIDIPIIYKTSNTDGANHFLIENALENQIVDFSSATYDHLILSFDKLDQVSDYYEIYFYPNKEEQNPENRLTFRININKVQTTNDDSRFEFEKLYNVSEGKNQIWYSYFDETLFNSFEFLNEEFNNSGLKFEFSDAFINSVNFEMDDLGFVSKATLKNKTSNWYIPEALTLSFTVCSLYEYNKDPNCQKYEYVIEVKNEFDGLQIKINDGEYQSTFDEIIMVKDQIYNIKVKAINNLEYKGTFQKKFVYNDINYKSSDKQVVVAAINKIQAIGYGSATVTFSYYASRFDNTYPITIKIKVVNNEGIIPTNPEIVAFPVSYDESCPPILDKNQFSVGTILEFSTPDFDCYRFDSKNKDVLDFISLNQAKCLKSGNVIIEAVNVNNPEDVLLYSIQIFNLVEDFKVNKGDFIEVGTGSKGVITIQVKTNKRYTFSLSKDQDYQFINKNDNNSVELYENGVLIVKKAGQFYIDIVVGEDDSPYKITKKILITSTDDGITANYRYFIRKAIGHFGLFFVTGIFACISLLFINCFKIKNKYVVIVMTLAFGIFLAFSTEFMQKTDPTRYFAVKDILLDCYGYLTAFILIFAIYLLKLFNKKKKMNKKKEFNEN